MSKKMSERRRFIRIEVPLSIKVSCGDWMEEAVTKNISPIGMRFELPKDIEKDSILDVSMYLPTSDDLTNVKCRVVWTKRSSLEDNSPYDVGVEIVDIEEGNKNLLLRYLCDLLYSSSYRA